MPRSARATRPAAAVALLSLLVGSGAAANPTRDPGPGLAAAGAEPAPLSGAAADPRIASACDPRERNWRSTLQALAALPGNDGVRALAEVIRRRLALAPAREGDSDPRVRDALSLLGGRRGSVAAAAAVRPALSSSDAGIRYAAVDALGAIACPAARTELAGVLDRDSEPLVAAAAVGALSRTGGADEGRLRALLVDPRAPVRSAAARVFFRSARPAALRDLPPEAAEIHALRLLSAAKRADLPAIRDFVHPMRRLEIAEEDRTTSFGATTLTPPTLRHEIVPVLSAAFELADSLACGSERTGRERRCAVYDAQGYVTEVHFTTVLGRIYLIRIRHHGGYADL